MNEREALQKIAEAFEALRLDMDEAYLVDEELFISRGFESIVEKILVKAGYRDE